jgi:hypothetical protein
VGDAVDQLAIEYSSPFRPSFSFGTPALRKYFWVAMSVASWDQDSGNSTSWRSKTTVPSGSLMTEERLVHLICPKNIFSRTREIGAEDDSSLAEIFVNFLFFKRNHRCHLFPLTCYQQVNSLVIHRMLCVKFH